MPIAPAAPFIALEGEKINASHLSALATYLNEYWQGATYSFAPYHYDHANNDHFDDRRYGWGQIAADVEKLVNSGTAITKSDIALTNHMNQIIAQINTAVDHQTDHLDASNNIINPFLTKRSVGVEIDSLAYASSLNEITTLGTNQYLVADLDLTPAAFSTTSLVSDAWTDDFYTEHKFIFANYNEARHFFNSGGELTFLLSMAQGINPGEAMWKDIFEQFDSIRIGAEACRIVNDPNDFNPTTSALSKGFYNGINVDGSYTTILDAAGGVGASDAYAYAYAYQSAYSAAYGGEYYSRRIRLELKAVETTTFDIYVKVTLLETDTEDTTIITPITLDTGHAQPATTPQLTDADVDYYTVDTRIYQFIAPTVPTIERVTAWTSTVAP